jgi:small subunit ribosomal protein S1
MMSNADKPDVTPIPEEAKPPESLRVKPGGTPIPSLEHEQHYGSGPRLKDLDAEIERELQEAMGGMSDKDMYGEPGQRGQKPAAGAEARKVARVIRVHGPDVFCDVPGGRSGGVLPTEQFPDGPPAVGTEVEVTIEGYDADNGLLVLSRKGAAVQADWSSVAVGMTVEARVTGVNKGGLSVDVNGIRGFMPISQIDLYRVENAEQYVNQRLLCRVVEVNPQERNLVVSRRDLLEKEREEQRERFWQEVAEGQIRNGVVRTVKEFGAFVDLGGADGLLHVSEMSWSRVADAGQFLQVGQPVKVIVLKVDRDRRKLSLGMKQLAPSPWDNVSANYLAGKIVPGKVTRLAEFGAFVELEPAIEGLIHISELSPQRVRRVRDVVQAGQEVQVMILSVDPAQRRISLSLKAALPKEEPPAEADEPAEEEIQAKPAKPRKTPLRGGIGE